MAMDNKTIIFLKRVELMEKGVLKGTGEFVEVEINGEIRKFEIPEEIHTYKRWQELGYQVTKGESSFIKFKVWTYDNRRIEEEAENGNGNTNTRRRRKCFLKTSAFFTMAQVHIPEAKEA